MNNYVVYIHRRMDFRPFYIGYGRPRRPYEYSDRSDDWKAIRERDGLIVQVLHTGLSKEEAKRIEAELIAGYRGILPGFLVNKSSGEGASGLFGEDSATFKGSVVGTCLDNRFFIVLAGTRAIEEAGFNPSSVSECLNGRYEHHRRMRWSRNDVVDRSQFDGLTEIFHANDLGIDFNAPEYHQNFSGFSVGISKCRTKFIILAGNVELAEAGFNHGNVSACILGRPGFKSHKKFTWYRMKAFNPEDFAGLSPGDQRSADRLNQFKI